MRPIRVVVALSAFVGLALFVSAAIAADETPTYIGADKCKMCHKVEYESWATMAHAKAWDVIKPEDQDKAECLKCHATGNSKEMAGVQCEACHGPGSVYKSMKIMKDPEASKAAGLIVPDEAVCKGCHAGEAPHELPAFDFATAKAKGLHAVKEK